MNQDNFCVIMAGGVGSRFWPMSTSRFPKQFIDFLGTGRSLIQQTYDRLRKLCPKENIFVVTNENYFDLVLEQLEGMTPEQVITEPSRRNTAPCIAYANYKIAEINLNANIFVAPADHLIMNEDEFIRIAQKAFDHTSKNDCLVTLGITPTRPDTGYGYIQFNDEHDSGNKEIKKVKTFTEKPDLTLAKQFVESGEFAWNSGMFVWSLDSISKAFEKYLPEVDNIFKDGIGTYNTEKENEFIEKAYSVCKSVSIDYGIMEKAENVFVLSADIGWSDLGTWGSVYNHIGHDEKGNAVQGKKVMMYDSSNNIVNVPKDKLVVLQGLDNYIVVEANNMLLVCQKQEEQKIKQFVNDIKVEKGEEFV